MQPRGLLHRRRRLGRAGQATPTYALTLYGTELYHFYRSGNVDLGCELGRRRGSGAEEQWKACLRRTLEGDLVGIMATR